MVETVLRVERDRAQSYLDVASALLVILYADGTVGLLNRHGRELLGDPAASWSARTGSTRWCRPRSATTARAAFERLVHGGEAASSTTRATW